MRLHSGLIVGVMTEGSGHDSHDDVLAGWAGSAPANDPSTRNTKANRRAASERLLPAHHNQLQARRRRTMAPQVHYSKVDPASRIRLLRVGPIW